MKINVQLLEYAAKSLRQGIPTLAGIPLARSLQAFGLHCSCCWFQLNAAASAIGDQFVEISLDETGFAFPNASDASVHGPLSCTQIQAIASKSRLVFWEEAVNILRSL